MRLAGRLLRGCISRRSVSEIDSVARNSVGGARQHVERSRGLADSRFLRAQRAQNHLSHYTYVTARTRRRQCQLGIYTVRRVQTRRIPPAFTHPRTYVQRAVSSPPSPPSPSLPYIFRTCTRPVRGTRKRASRFAPLTRYTGCYNEGDVISGISGADREEEARSVGW